MQKIKDFSVQSGFSIRMLRYLEDMEILTPTRSEKNYRLYDEALLPKALKIKELQDLDFQLREIKNLENPSIENQLEILQKVLAREKDIAEIKSDTVPRIGELIETIRSSKVELFKALELPKKPLKKFQTLEGDEKFKRTMYSIPALREVYEEHIALECKVDLISTDFAKFKDYVANADYNPEVFSIFEESSFAFGLNLSSDFLQGYEKSWKKFFKTIGFNKLEQFEKNDTLQLMGPHDLVIRTDFVYSSGEKGEIVIPYTPIFMLTK